MSALTKTGQPRQGARIEVQLEDDSWIAGVIVGKAFGKGAQSRTVLAVVLEHTDSVGSWRTGWLPWGGPDGIIWREPRESA